MQQSTKKGIWSQLKKEQMTDLGIREQGVGDIDGPAAYHKLREKLLLLKHFLEAKGQPVV